MTNLEKLQASLDNMIQELYQHTIDRVAGKERVTYTLNGRNFDWNTYNREMAQQIKDLQAVINSFQIPYAITRAC